MSETPRSPRFKSSAEEAAFFAAYDAVLTRWPVSIEAVDVPSRYGTTHVQVCGPPEGTPLVLLHGGGATSTVWFANVEALTCTHRVFAVDQLGDAGAACTTGSRSRGRRTSWPGWIASSTASASTSPHSAATPMGRGSRSTRRSTRLPGSASSSCWSRPTVSPG